ncbi:MAG: energy transducer TonB [Myxococcota bacterium]
MKRVCFAAAALIGACSSANENTAPVAVATLPELSDSSPVDRIAPRYPEEAKRDGTEGCVTVEFTVGPNGEVVAPKVTASEPPGVFDASAIEAVQQWKYEPRIINGEPVQYRVQPVVLSFAGEEDTGEVEARCGRGGAPATSFALGKSVQASPIYRSDPVYPPSADGAEGCIALRVTVDVDGRVASSAVVAALPEGVFDDAAKAAVSTWRFEPRVSDGGSARYLVEPVVLAFSRADVASSVLEAACHSTRGLGGR